MNVPAVLRIIASVECGCVVHEEVISKDSGKMFLPAASSSEWYYIKAMGLEL